MLHLWPFRHGMRILVVQPVDQQDLGGHLPRTGRARRRDERRDTALVRLRDEIGAKDLRPGGARRQRLDVAVEVINASILRLERARQPNGLGHVPGKWNPELVGLRSHHIEGVAGNARVNLEQVVTRLVLLGDHRDRGVGRLRAVVIERGARRVDARAKDFALRQPLAVDEVPRIAQHAADRGHAVSDIEKQRALDVGLRRLAAGNVRVELAESRHEDLPLPSTFTAPAGTCAFPAGAIDAIFPSVTTTVWSASTASLSIGSTFTPMNAVAAACATARLKGELFNRVAAATATRTDAGCLAIRAVYTDSTTANERLSHAPVSQAGSFGPGSGERVGTTRSTYLGLDRRVDGDRALYGLDDRGG